jgi:hypothetical protein
MSTAYEACLNQTYQSLRNRGYSSDAAWREARSIVNDVYTKAPFNSSYSRSGFDMNEASGTLPSYDFSNSYCTRESIPGTNTTSGSAYAIPSARANYYVLKEVRSGGYPTTTNYSSGSLRSIDGYYVCEARPRKAYSPEFHGVGGYEYMHEYETLSPRSKYTKGRSSSYTKYNIHEARTTGKGGYTSSASHNAYDGYPASSQPKGSKEDFSYDGSHYTSHSGYHTREAAPKGHSSSSRSHHYSGQSSSSSSASSKRRFSVPSCVGLKPSVDLYVLLGASSSASADELKKAYRVLSMKNHPDRVNGGEVEKAKATSRMAEINRAYDVLKDEKRRNLYDRTGEVFDIEV